MIKNIAIERNLNMLTIISFIFSLSFSDIVKLFFKLNITPSITFLIVSCINFCFLFFSKNISIKFSVIIRVSCYLFSDKFFRKVPIFPELVIKFPNLLHFILAMKARKYFWKYSAQETVTHSLALFDTEGTGRN